MKYKVVITKNDDGYTVNCPDLPGCWSQGETIKDAAENMQSAILEYSLAIRGLDDGPGVGAAVD